MNEPNVMTDERLDVIYHAATVNGMGVSFSAEAVIAIIDRLKASIAENRQLKWANEVNHDEHVQIMEEIGVPECPLHGGYCSPHVAKWMRETKERAEKAEAENRQKGAEIERLNHAAMALLLSSPAGLKKTELGGERWIEIKEGCEMPEVDTRVLMLYAKGEEIEIGRWSCEDRSFPELHGIWWGDQHTLGKHDIAHWKPLPAPPTREKE